MQTSSIAANPFMLLLNPEVVIAAVERSENLAQLSRRICYPLDRMPVTARPAREMESADDESTEVDLTDEDVPGLIQITK